MDDSSLFNWELYPAVEVSMYSAVVVSSAAVRRSRRFMSAPVASLICWKKVPEWFPEWLGMPIFRETCFLKFWQNMFFFHEFRKKKYFKVKKTIFEIFLFVILLYEREIKNKYQETCFTKSVKLSYFRYADWTSNRSSKRFVFLNGRPFTPTPS